MTISHFEKIRKKGARIKGNHDWLRRIHLLKLHLQIGYDVDWGIWLFGYLFNWESFGLGV
jgi:hypothetical protein